MAESTILLNKIDKPAIKRSLMATGFPRIPIRPPWLHRSENCPTSDINQPNTGIGSIKSQAVGIKSLNRFLGAKYE